MLGNRNMSDLGEQTPYAHQSEYTETYGLDRSHILIWQPRTGKTRATLYGTLRLILEKGVRRILIVGQQTGCDSVWRPECRVLADKIEDLIVVDLYSGKVEERINTVKGLDNLTKSLPNSVQMLIVNRDVLFKLSKHLIKWKPQLLIIDELQDYIKPGSVRSRAAFSIANVTPYKRGLTGTPIRTNFGNVYGQWKIIAPTVFGTNKNVFDSKYLIWNKNVKFPKLTGYTNLNELKEKAFSVASVKLRSECFDVPDEIPVIREVVIPTHARQIYDKIVHDHVLELQLSIDNNIRIPLAHTLTRMQQLRQVTIGYSRFNEEDTFDLVVNPVTWLHDAKLDSVEADAEEILDADEKLVIFHAFLPEGDEIAKRLSRYKPIILRGGISPQERSKRIESFNNSPKREVIIVQEQVGSASISLAGADNTIFLSCGLDHVIHSQARGRIFKPKRETDHKLTYGYVWVGNSVDMYVKQLLSGKQSLENYFMDTKNVVSTFQQIAYWAGD